MDRLSILRRYVVLIVSSIASGVISIIWYLGYPQYIAEYLIPLIYTPQIYIILYTFWRLPSKDGITPILAYATLLTILVVASIASIY